MNSPNFWNSSIESLAAYGEYSHELNPQNTKQPYIPVNTLSSALSPYLRSHALDPIGWHQWSQNTFDMALREDRPIFVSVAYHGNHWANVMARDCWLDIEVASLLNSSFIPVLVDSHERQDIDILLTELCRLQNGSSGYPLNVFMTGEGRVFFAATWLPKRTMGNVPGITELLPRVKWLWHMQRHDIYRSADELHKLFSLHSNSLNGNKRKHSLKHSHSDAISALRKAFNIHWGGFSWENIPKLPHYPAILFLLQGVLSGIFSSIEKSDAITMADITLRRMWRGGIHDHLGGGFHHYAVDERWHVPHFEKLLCEQALMLLAASFMQQINPKPFNRLLAEDIIFCALHDFASEESYSQGFRASIDGDTPDGEGRYFLWTEDEIKAVLPAHDAGLFCSAYGVLPGGNFAPEFGSSHLAQNILYEASTVTELAQRYGIRPADVGDKITASRKLLLNARNNRYTLNADNNILMGWNGLMIGALARASVAFDVAEWKDLAERSALFLYKNLQDKNNTFYRNWLNGQRWGIAQCDDYAYFLWGILELYHACNHFGSGDKQLSEWLHSAQTLADKFISALWDNSLGGFFASIDNNFPHFSFKSPEDFYACSLPNYNSVAAIALSQLGNVLQEKSYSDYSKRIIDTFSAYAYDFPLQCLTLIAANSLWLPVKQKIVHDIPPAAPVSPTANISDEQLNAQDTTTPVAAKNTHSDNSPRRRANRASRRHKT